MSIGVTGQSALPLAPDCDLSASPRVRSVDYTTFEPDIALSSAHHGRIVLDRRILTSADVHFSKNAGLPSTKQSLTRRLRQRCVRSCRPKALLSETSYFARCVFPCIDTLVNYRWRTDLLSDLSAGLTVGVMNVPQGMAYSMLAGLPPVYGLYVSFIAPLFYAIFGRCAQLSLGTFAVVSLLLSEPIRRLCDQIVDQSRENNTSINWGNLIPVCYSPDSGLHENDPSLHGVGPEQLFDLRPVIAVTLTFFIGVLQILIGLFHLGNLTCYLAPAMVDGFVTGAAVHVLTSQIASLFGVKAAAKGDGIGSLFMVYVNLFKNITHVNPITTGISALSIVFLLLIKLWLEPFLQRCGHCSFPLPSELILVTIGTVVSQQIGLKANFNVSIVGKIESGMPELTVPVWSLFPQMIADTLVIGLTSTFLTISLVKLFAIKYKLELKYNHELTALGFISLACSFFASFAPSASVSRSMVCEGAGARTPLNGIASSILIVFVLLYLGPYFSVTPTCVLSAIIAVALKNILKRVLRLPKLWKKYKRDFLLFFVTFVVTLFFDVTGGLLVGIVGCLLALTEKQRNLKLIPIVHVRGTEIFLPDERKFSSSNDERNVHDEASFELPSIMTFKLIGSLNFASGEQLMPKLQQLMRQQQPKNQQIYRQYNPDRKLNNTKELNNQIQSENTKTAETDVEGTCCRQYGSVIHLDGSGLATRTSPRGVLEGLSVSDMENSEERFANQRISQPNGQACLEYPSIRRISEEPIDGGTRLSVATFDNATPDDSRNIIVRPELSIPKAFLLIDTTGLTHIDPTGLEFLREAHNELYEKQICLVYGGDLNRLCDIDPKDWSTFPSISLSYATLLDAYVACYWKLYGENLTDSPVMNECTIETRF